MLKLTILQIILLIKCLKLASSSFNLRATMLDVNKHTIRYIKGIVIKLLPCRQLLCASIVKFGPPFGSPVLPLNPAQRIPKEKGSPKQKKEAHRICLRRALPLPHPLRSGVVLHLFNKQHTVCNGGH